MSEWDEFQYEYDNNHREWSDGELDEKIIETAFNNPQFIKYMDDWISEHIQIYEVEKVEPLRAKIEELTGKTDKDRFPVFRPTLRYLNGDYKNLRDDESKYWVYVEQLFLALNFEGFTEALNPTEYEWMFSGKRMLYEGFEPVKWLGAKNLCVYLFNDVLPSKKYQLYENHHLPKKIGDIFGIKNVRSVIQNNFNKKDRKPTGYEKIDALVQTAFDEELFHVTYSERLEEDTHYKKMYLSTYKRNPLSRLKD